MMGEERRWTRAASGVAVLAAAGLWLATGAVDAADHTDPPGGVTAGDAADIGDLYAWHTDASLVVVLTFAGPVAPAEGQRGAWDPSVLYGIHLDNTGDNAPNASIWLRYGQNALGDWGVQVINLPGTAGPVVGPVEQTLEPAAGARVWTGLRDDPFFFDSQGFQDTVATGTLAFDPGRDFFAGMNITVAVLEMPLAAALGAGDSVQLWATTARQPEQ